MKVNYVLFLVLGVVGLLLIGAGETLVKNSTKEVSRSYSAAFDPDIHVPGVTLPYPLGAGAAARTQTTEKTLGVVVALVAHGLLAIAVGVYAVGQGRSPWFGLLGLLSPIGLLFAAALQDRSVKVGELAGSSSQ